MATAVKKTISLPPELARLLDEMARADSAAVTVGPYTRSSAYQAPMKRSIFASSPISTEQNSATFRLFRLGIC